MDAKLQLLQDPRSRPTRPHPKRSTQHSTHSSASRILRQRPLSGTSIHRRPRTSQLQRSPKRTERKQISSGPTKSDSQRTHHILPQRSQQHQSSTRTRPLYAHTDTTKNQVSTRRCPHPRTLPEPQRPNITSLSDKVITEIDTHHKPQDTTVVLRLYIFEHIPPLAVPQAALLMLNLLFRSMLYFCPSAKVVTLSFAPNSWTSQAKTSFRDPFTQEMQIKGTFKESYSYFTC